MFITPSSVPLVLRLETGSASSGAKNNFLLYQLTAQIAKRLQRPFPGNFTFFLIYIGKLATTSPVEIGAVCVQQ
jgi:hypothetical protein